MGLIDLINNTKIFRKTEEVNVLQRESGWGLDNRKH